MNPKDPTVKPVGFYLKKSEVFCMMPWVHMHSWPDGRVMPCCLGNPDSPLGHLDNGLKETWNNKKYKALRRRMLNDEPTPDQCQRCYSFDKAGTESLRKTANRKFSAITCPRSWPKPTWTAPTASSSCAISISATRISATSGAVHAVTICRARGTPRA